MKSKIILFAALSFFLLLCVWIVLDNIPNEKITWFRQTNPDQSMIVEGKYEDPPPLGPHKVFVYINGELIITTEIGNDGKQIDDANYQLVWLDDGAILSFFGEEQLEEAFQINVINGDISYSLIKDKYQRD